ncbi:MAG: glycoside hydrolase family 11 protein [Defluviitaleaceae bacterium]|nr:glycoside hydrolase family 11 protein [Defluviitaleaceae bacterium]
MTKMKKILIAQMRKVLVAAILSTAVLGSAAPALATLDFHQNWTSDTLNGPANGTSNGPDGTATFRSNMQTGNFSAEWQTTRANSRFNNLHGLGWATGRANRRIGYNLGFLEHHSGHQGMTIGAFYGWTRSPLIEYYVLDNWLNHRSTPGTLIGTVTSDGGTYEVWRANQNGHNINGMGPFVQIKSVRTTPRPMGQNNVITFQNHANAWASMGSPLGTEWSYQVYIIEGWESTGRGNATVWELP